MNFYVYILECAHNKLYTGYTTDLERRYQEHVDGSSKAKFTRAFPPKRLAASWQVESKSAAMKLEYQIKKMSRGQKLTLIAEQSSR